MSEVGRPTELNEELLVKIKHGVLDGKDNKTISQELGIPYDTFEGWIKRNYDNFADNLLTYKHERMLLKAESNLEEAMAMNVENEGTTRKGDKFQFTDPKLWQVKADVSMFVAETIGRKNYHKKRENEIVGDPMTVEVVYGKKDTDRLLSESTSAVAGENTG